MDKGIESIDGKLLVRCGEHGALALGHLTCSHMLTDPSLYVDNGAVSNDMDYGDAVCGECMDKGIDGDAKNLLIACEDCLVSLIGEAYRGTNEL